MRDKQAFEAYVLEKSKIEKKKIAMRRKTILTAGTALCVCLIVLMVLPGILDVGLTSDGTNGVPEAWPMGSVGGTDDEGDGTSEKVETTEEPTRRPTRRPTTKPLATSDKNYGNSEQPKPPVATQKALPLDKAFAQNKSDYAIPDRINGITEVANIRKICDWVMNGNFIEGNQPEKVDCTMTIYYGKDTIVCYIAEEGFFKMGEGAWLKTAPAYVKELMNLLKGD